MVNIYDVAKEAQVSQTAVSMVLNNRTDQVSDETRVRILKAIDKLGYTPSRAARQLAGGKSGIIGISFEQPSHQVFASPPIIQLIASVGDYAAGHELDLLFSPTGPNRNISAVIKNLVSHGVDGAVIVGPILLNPATTAAIDTPLIPIVCIDSYPGFTKASSVDSDNVTPIKKGVEHLISQGHKRIVFFGNLPLYQCFADRMRAFCDAMQEHCLDVDEHALRIVSLEHVAGSVRRLLKSAEPPTAVVCADITYGTVVWDSLAKAGVRVPDDIAMFVFDGLPQGHPGADIVSSAVVDSYQQGKMATETLKRIIDGESSAPLIVKVPPKITLLPALHRTL